MRFSQLRTLVNQLVASGTAGELHDVGGAGEPAYSNSYTGVGIGAFFRTNGDRTELEGRVGKAGAAAAADAVFTLPADNRPERDTWLNAVITDNDTAAAVDGQVFVTAATGQVLLVGPGIDGVTNIRVALDGLSFRNA